MKTQQEKLEEELQRFFPHAEITNYGRNNGVSISQDTFYSLDRHELVRLEKKYKAGLWCDVRNNKVHYHFHTLGR